MNAPVIAGTERRRVRFHVLRVGEVQRLCDDAVSVRFEIPDQLAEAFAFRPGQSVTLRRYVDGSEYRRSYSICAGLGERPRIGVRSVPDGVVSDWLVRDLRPGDEIEVAEPSGGFVPDLAVDERHVCIAAGSGITPVLSVTSSVLRHTRGSVTLLYGNRRTDTVMFADDLADLKDEFPERLELIHVLSREPRDAELFTGRMDADKIRAVLSRVVEPRDVDQWWLCGPYPMVRDAQTVLHEHEIERSRIHRELFFVDEQPPATRHHADPPSSEAASEVTVLLDGRATTTSVPHTSPILDGVQQVRPDLPFACKGGVCGTCRAKVISGNVHMRRNFALEPEEVDAGFVLTCQSLPLSKSVRVDYDA